LRINEAANEIEKMDGVVKKITIRAALPLGIDEAQACGKMKKKIGADCGKFIWFLKSLKGYEVG